MSEEGGDGEGTGEGGDTKPVASSLEVLFWFLLLIDKGKPK